MALLGQNPHRFNYLDFRNSLRNAAKLAPGVCHVWGMLQLAIRAKLGLRQGTPLSPWQSGVVGAAHQWTGLHMGESHFVSRDTQFIEFGRRHVADHGQMLR